MKYINLTYIRLVCICSILCFALRAEAGLSAQEKMAKDILDATGIQGGFIVHVGCGDGKLTAALRQNDSYLVHGIDKDTKLIAQAREYIQSLGLYGKVSVDCCTGNRLLYIDNLVNLLVSENLGEISMDEVMRVLCPNGVAYIKKGGDWKKTVKGRPKEIDNWTHYLHDASNNAVSHDMVVGPPRRMQWIGSPRWARHHDRMSSVSAVVSNGGRIFYIIDEAPRFSILVDPKWSLIARDAFNGTILWKRPISKWHTHLWPLKSGPAQLPRRLVSEGDSVYVTLRLDGPVTALDTATGKTLQTYRDTKATEEIILKDGILLLLVNKQAKEPDFANLKRIGGAYGSKFWDEQPREVMAVRADTGEVLWELKSRVLPGTLAADKQQVYFHNGNCIVCLDRNTGDEKWRSVPVERADEILSFYLPTLLVYKEVVLFSGGETAGKQTGSWYNSGKDTMTALSTETGKVLWTAYHPPSGYRSPEDLLVANGLVWTGETTSGRAVGVFTGRDPLTGDVKTEFSPDVETYWFHHRCYRGKATDKYLLMSRAGTEFIDIRNEKWIPHHWVRGACLYGVMPANGLIYNPPHPCACYLEAKLYGFNALAPASAGPRVSETAAKETRLEKGPAYNKKINSNMAKDEWPTYRHDEARSGCASTVVPTTLKRAWWVEIGGKLTSPVTAGGKVFTASVDTHTIYAIEDASGKKLWQFTAGGRIDSPPTVYQGRLLFGSADGWVYCLTASEGALVWRFRAAPTDQRLMSFEQLESVWPVHGSVLVRDGIVYCVSGRSMFLDGGLRMLRLDAKTGKLLSETFLNEHDSATNTNIQDYISWLNMPPALPDILSSDGRLIYMRSQCFNTDGERLEMEKFPSSADADKGAPPATQRADHAHLFCPTGFLDDSWWHRSYWMYGSRFISGWCGYFLAGKAAPSGRILTFDDSKVYGFGRKPQYYRWTTPIEYHLFAADKLTTESQHGEGIGKSQISVSKSTSLNPVSKELTVEAWVKTEKPGGVILARGGSSHGYAMYLENNMPRFVIRIAGEITCVKAKTKLTNQWVHLTGVLNADKELRIYVNGKQAGSAKAPGLFTTDPQEAMEIGADAGSTVGDYSSSFAFKGLIDELRIYNRALSPVEIARQVSANRQTESDRKGLALWYTFDNNDAVDESGNKNDGTPEGVVTVKGKFGKAVRFTGKSGTVPDFLVQHNWTKDMSIFIRAMVLTDKVLFVAGPPDVLDEPQAFKQINDPQVRRDLAEQVTAFNGNKGASLAAISIADGTELARYELDSPPVFDGMAAAAGRLYLTTIDGSVISFKGDH